MDSNIIAELNDRLRTTFAGGQIVVTEGIQALSELHQRAVFEAVRKFNDFKADNDPYGERDFGVVEVVGCKVYWKIDYYDLNMEYQSENPANPSITKRILTIMRADEY